ncbi:DNA polymerase-4 [Parabacteroides sp. PFB2-12]|uniref:DNA polymerase IV n=1 Tax=unclassified Parabacteroides TaxID=2649774 RepID=UPI002476F757|nr:MULTISPECIES: DNA polymerase IV [unclassified Parabacteroides]MDH6344018.1 DNA polymerase-4 [Parabacteroides sp. PM6-13]MDH6391878.1 DNA polymerase-4 [Parabacteroides sp. PFB2-12]
MIRKIIHIDMDAFYASIEQRDNPSLRGRPIAVGHAEARGVVAAASYEARVFGVRSAMPSVTAKRKCPDLIFVEPHFETYKEVSQQIMEVFLTYTDLVEPLSLDEAFLDVTDHPLIPSATLIAKDIKQKIKETTGLTASAGVSFNKFLAKIASDYNKPDGLFVITPAEAENFVEKLNVERFFGVGRITADKMHRLGIHTGADLKRHSEAELIRHFGKAGSFYYLNARAIDERPVTPDRIRKSVGAENTFETDLGKSTRLTIELYHIARRVWERIEAKEFFGRTITLKIKFADFEIITRSRTFPQRINNFRFFLDSAKEILNQTDVGEKKIRLMGLSVSNIEDPEKEDPLQLEINFEE